MIAGTEHMAAPVSLSCDAGLQRCALYFFGLEHATKSICDVRLELCSIDIACSSFFIQHQRLPGRTSWLRTANERSLFLFFLKCSTYMTRNFSSAQLCECTIGPRARLASHKVSAGPGTPRAWRAGLHGDWLWHPLRM